ncbi:ImmA/IrrE family metallo-endopeptidase [Paenarthrobacter nitroguajacolicus]|uniref:ImmA/IrrE family metallo-endopeptidase n=1 Tax=Paenarthrobacter nitroguajacolicus TaxID=211146 RepID=UPI0015B7D690|nr:ImmA/IrrE family metallo-endopeptidase [Paenarthrobacter nitroguajacolicus]NWL32931.1 XRE family transcriptional regulator [Paenarthrobacter nitroguajacolicus]
MFETPAANLSNTALLEYAERVGRHHGIYDDKGRADLHRFVEALGGQIGYATNSESLHVRSIGDFTVYLPHSTSARRDRFTLAHELGHYFLHYLYPHVEGERGFERGSRNRAETEANVFASALLMPRDEFVAAHRRFDGDVWKLAVNFDVSPDAATVRAKVLGL